MYIYIYIYIYTYIYIHIYIYIQHASGACCGELLSEGWVGVRGYGLVCEKADAVLREEQERVGLRGADRKG